MEPTGLLLRPVEHANISGEPPAQGNGWQTHEEPETDFNPNASTKTEYTERGFNGPFQAYAFSMEGQAVFVSCRVRDDDNSAIIDISAG
ncbi:hypothetical protein MMC26_002160 [Xylographa opegraphella]|nr:hypothetical protein [Xylographa opegraphella]